MNRLDRFLLSEGFIEKGGVSNQWIGERDIFDHCPIWLVCSNLDWGPKPFKFNNCWLEHPDFIPFVIETWKKLEVKEDQIACGNGDATIFNSKELVKRFWEHISIKESLLHQKSRTKWVQEGDSNSRFFHASIKSRRRINQLVMLKKGDDWIQGVANIKNEVKDHFSKHFSEEWNSRPFLQGINFNMLSDEDNGLLLEPFTGEEVKEIIWSCDSNKSPGGWCIVRNNVMAFLREFHGNAFLPKAVTASFFTLIPKKDHPQDLFDYRPICLIGSLSKKISKLLANRLKRVLGKLISNCQSAFLPHRQILYGVVVINEIIDLAKRRKDNCLLFKVDFERAYDTDDVLSIRREGEADWFKSHVRCGVGNGLSLQPNGVDKWRWMPDSDDNVLGAIQKLWKNDVPSKRCGKRYLGGQVALCQLSWKTGITLLALEI
ncbi:hypothetical protein TSUD_106720 [Trifolium subterraneum]|uniref:Reverse transcriptase domain-containing protein n=1 Tax=Trifolium subterraneum TaxID=3900 RepID=A0A2Z6LSL3_TRISU|nr:hypothetical protein TSUD_106720 [Trifolium subterraneum]